MSEYLEYEVEVQCPNCDHRDVEHIEFEMANRNTFVKAHRRSVVCTSCHMTIHISPTITLDIDANVEDTSQPDDESDE